MDFLNKTKLKFTVPFSSFFLLFLSFHYINANLLTHQRCWHIKINLSVLNVLNKVKFNEISGMLQFYLIFDSQDCY